MSLGYQFHIYGSMRVPVRKLDFREPFFPHFSSFISLYSFLSFFTKIIKCSQNDWSFILLNSSFPFEVAFSEASVSDSDLIS